MQRLDLPRIPGVTRLSWLRLNACSCPQVPLQRRGGEVLRLRPAGVRVLRRGNDGEVKETRNTSSRVASRVTDVTFLFNLPDEDLRLRHGQVHGLLLREGEDGVHAALWLCRFRGNKVFFL